MKTAFIVVINIFTIILMIAGWSIRRDNKKEKRFKEESYVLDEWISQAFSGILL